MRLSPVVLAASLAWAGACGGVLNREPSAAPGGSGGIGGSASGAAAGTTGAAGQTRVVTTTSLGGRGNASGTGNGGAGGCDSSPAACACDSTAAACQPALMSACLGTHCPPSLDDAMRVANWTDLGGANGAWDRARGEYSLCPDGSHWFSFQYHSAGYGIGYDASGRLVVYDTYASGTCGQVVCGDRNVAGPSLCSGCQMWSDPAPAGSFLIPRGISNGPLPNCEVDADGRWSQPQVAPPN